jgi:hypothetical protein
MLASINPLGERGRNQRYAVTVTAYLVASAAAGGALGAALGALGQVTLAAAPATIAVAAVGVAAAVGLLADRRGRVPGPHRQVDENWLVTYRGWVYGAGFGAQLGAAFTTIVSASATWVAFLCAFAGRSVGGGLVVGVTFGLVRALPVLGTARVHDPARLRALVRSLDRWRPRAAAATAATQAGAVVLLVAAAGTL